MRAKGEQQLGAGSEPTTSVATEEPRDIFSDDQA
jgi:hypothetical protein